MTELRKLQMALLDIALEIKRICEKNKIPYILCGGSLLGAVRHNGFIPWDDDMDIAMLRNDYETFIDLCTHELGNDYILQTNEVDNQYANSFAKIGIRDTQLVNVEISNQDLSQYISVDVFPLDSFPKSKLKKKLQYFFEQSLCTAAYIKADYQVDKPITVQGKIRRYLVKKYAYNHTLAQILKCMVLLEKKYNKSQTEEIGLVFFKEHYISKEKFLDVTTCQFENYDFPIPKSFDTILTGIYGNYMELPPEEKRVAHNFKAMNLGLYKIHNETFLEQENCFEEL